MVLTAQAFLRRTALWVVPVAELAGVGRHVLETMRSGLPGWNPVVLCPDGPLARALEQQQSAVLTASVGPEAGVRRSVSEVRRVVRRLQPLVVHTHLSYADFVGAAASLRRRPALVTTEHGISGDSRLYHQSASHALLKARLHKTRLRRCDAVIAVSDATADAMRRRWSFTGDIDVIRNGVKAPSTRPVGQPGYRLLSLARLAPEKRVPELLDVFARLLDDEPEAHLTLAGSGPLQAQLQRQASDLGIRSSVCFPGHVDAATAMREADVLVQLSAWENCSYSLLDAMAHGLGIVASNVGGNPEMLPARCLVRVEDREGLLARLHQQAKDPSVRPCLPTGWPSVEEQCSKIVAAYEKALQWQRRP